MRLHGALTQACALLVRRARPGSLLQCFSATLISAVLILAVSSPAKAQDDRVLVSIATPTLAAGTAGHLFEIEGDPDSKEAVPRGGWILARTGDGTGALSVKVKVTETDGDFVPAGREGSQTVAFADGETTVAYRPIEDDSTRESHGTVTVAVEASNDYEVDSANGSAAVAVRDDDKRMEFTVDPLDLSVVEGEAAQFRVVLRTTDPTTFTEAADVARVLRARNGSSPGRMVPFGLSWITDAVEAESPDDYEPVSVMFRIAASEFVPDGSGYTARRNLQRISTVTDLENEGPERLIARIERSPETITEAAAAASRNNVPDLLDDGDVVSLSGDTFIAAVLTITDPLPSGDATLSGFTLTVTDTGSAVELDPQFASDESDYSAEVPVGVQGVTLEATANHSGAALKYMNAKEGALPDEDPDADGYQIGLILGVNVVKVQVEAENGMKQIYTVSVTRPGEPLTLNVDTVAGDDVVNIREKADGFAIDGSVLNDDTRGMNGATVTVDIAGETIAATSDSGGAWSVDIPATADYLNEPSVTLTVNATNAPFLPAPEVARILAVDLTPPALVSATAEEALLTLTFDEPLGANGVPPSVFSVVVNDVALSRPTPVAVGNSAVVLGLPYALSPGDTVKVSYSAPVAADGKAIRDVAGNPARPLTDHPVVNESRPGERCAGSDGTMRLADGADSKEGRVEVCADDDTTDATPARWGVVCDDYWTNDDADVVCRALGFERSEPHAGRFRQSYFGSGTGPIWLDDMQCTGDEANLLDCVLANGPRARDAIGQHNCKVTEIVGVRCMAAGDPLKPHVAYQIEITHPGEDRRYEPRDTLSVRVKFNESVIVDSSNGTPSISLALGLYNDAVSRAARYADGSGTEWLEFHYRVTAEDGAFAELQLLENSLATNGGTIRNAAGLDAILAHSSTAEPIERFLQLPSLGVADASAQEGEPLQFNVSLSYPQASEVSVSYRTEPGTATAGADFDASSGTLTFAPGQTELAISVVILDDAHDDSGETLTLVLADARGARIASGTATGTIINSDPMPQAWLARFGRTAADHAVDAIGTRFGSAETTRAPRTGAAASSLAEIWQRAGLETVSGTLDTTGSGWLTDLSAWGRITDSSFSGADGALSLAGEVATATIGLDGRRGRWLSGIALSHSVGEGGYRHETAPGGQIASTLSSLHPYAHYSAGDRLSLWGVLGYGVGDLTLAADGAENRIRTRLGSKMLSFGGRGQLQPTLGRFELAWVSDALLTDTGSQSATGLRGAAAETSRVRLMLEGSASIALANGGVLTPTVEAGLRYDGGDAETGAGVEFGGGLAYAAGRIAVQVDGRTLLMHRDAAYEEWGFGSTIVYRSRDDGRGLSFNIGSTWGVTRSGVRSLWEAYGIGHLSRDSSAAAAQRFELELGYGLARSKGPGLWYPFVAANAGDGGGESLRAGFRTGSGRNLNASAEIGRLVLADGSSDYAIQLRCALRW